MTAFKWQPIQPADTASEQYDFSEIDSLQQQWLNIKNQYDESSKKAYDTFRERLERSWAIETGIIEGLYTLGRGVTETLIKEGIAADFIERGDTNRDPQDLVTVLKDQERSHRICISVYSRRASAYQVIHKAASPGSHPAPGHLFGSQRVRNQV